MRFCPNGTSSATSGSTQYSRRKVVNRKGVSYPFLDFWLKCWDLGLFEAADTVQEEVDLDLGLLSTLSAC